MLALSLSCGRFRRGGQRPALRGADRGLPGMPGTARCLHQGAPPGGGGAAGQIPRLFPTGNSAGHPAGRLGRPPTGLASMSASLSGPAGTLCGGLEGSGPVSALRKFHGKKRRPLPALGLTRLPKLLVDIFPARGRLGHDLAPPRNGQSQEHAQHHSRPPADGGNIILAMAQRWQVILPTRRFKQICARRSSADLQSAGSPICLQHCAAPPPPILKIAQPFMAGTRCPHMPKVPPGRKVHADGHHLQTAAIFSTIQPAPAGLAATIKPESFVPGALNGKEFFSGRNAFYLLTYRA